MLSLASDAFSLLNFKHDRLDVSCKYVELCVSNTLKNLIKNNDYVNKKLNKISKLIVIKVVKILLIFCPNNIVYIYYIILFIIILIRVKKKIKKVMEIYRITDSSQR